MLLGLSVAGGAGGSLQSVEFTVCKVFLATSLRTLERDLRFGRPSVGSVVKRIRGFIVYGAPAMVNEARALPASLVVRSLRRC
jgi:hypothetical protein